MEIRSVTLFAEPQLEPANVAGFCAAARDAFALPVQSLRLATTPFPDWWHEAQGTKSTGRAPSAAVLATEFAGRWKEVGIDYASLGPVQLRHDAGWLNEIPALLSATGMLFVSVEVADNNGRIDVNRCWQAADVIRRVSTILDNGFGNLYLTALANCPPGSPFFPVAYHAGGATHFAVAAEAADLALAAIQQSRNLAQARRNLVTAIETAAAEITAAAQTLAAAYQIPFAGIDFSLAPYPTPDKSLAGALEALGVPHVGAWGSLFAAAFITEAIDRANFDRCGFSGLMLPVLEDSVLARRAGAGQVTVNDLLGYAAVCGVGLDTVPLPGDISQDSLAAILLDVAALATRLDKPLTARLMPLPGLAAGDPAQFDFPYFADSHVMAVTGDGVAGLLQQGERLSLHKVNSQ